MVKIRKYFFPGRSESGFFLYSDTLFLGIVYLCTVEKPGILFRNSIR